MRYVDEDSNDDATMQRQAAKLGAKECVLKSGGFYPLYERIERYAAATH